MLILISKENDLYKIRNTDLNITKTFSKSEVEKLKSLGTIVGLNGGYDGVKSEYGYEIGQVFGDYRLIYPIKGSHGMWGCQCTKCGYIRETRVADLRNGSHLKCDICNKDKREVKCKHVAGETYGDMILVEKIHNSRNWKCKCKNCGAEYSKGISHLMNGYGTQCKICSKKEFGNRNVHHAGEVYGDFELIEYIPNSHGQWKCKCKTCGNMTVKSVYTISVGNNTCRICNPITYKVNNNYGEIFGDYRLLEYKGSKLWKCECTNCGDIKEKYIHHLKNDVGTKCRVCNPIIPKSRNNTAGEVYGDFKTVEYISGSGGYWLCECIKCGYRKKVSIYDLKRDSGIQCIKCNKERYKHKDLRGIRFGYLVPVEYKGNGMWNCKCENCNSTELKTVSTSNLLNGSTISCGCLKEDLIGTETEKWFVLDRLSNGKYLCKCKNCGYKDEITYNYVRYKKCINCEPRAISNYEKEIEEIFSAGIRNDRSVLNGKELDFYFKDKNIAVEFNGDYWHSELYKDKYYHRDKTLSCIAKGIRLIHIFEYEWILDDTKEKLISLLKNALDDNSSNIIHARNTVIKEVDNRIAYDFLCKNHLQGGVNSSINIGLYFNNELVSLMSFGKPRFSFEYEYELLRLAYKKDIHLVGGSEKMFKYFKEKYKPNSIISYCNLAKFDGKVYNRLGFEFNGITEPNYVWVHYIKHDALSRYKTTRKKLVKQYELDENDSSITEDSIMHNLGYIKVYDSGNAKYVWKAEV